jgi:hypothetical protein
MKSQARMSPSIWMPHQEVLQKTHGHEDGAAGKKFTTMF